MRNLPQLYAAARLADAGISEAAFCADPVAAMAGADPAWAKRHSLSATQLRQFVQPSTGTAAARQAGTRHHADHAKLLGAFVVRTERDVP